MSAPLSHAPPRLSQQLDKLIVKFAHQPSVRVEEIVTALEGRSYLLLMIVLSLPFITPIPIPLLSLPFGLATAYIAARMTLGLPPTLPRRLLNAQIPTEKLAAILRACSRVMNWIEARTRTRLTAIADLPGATRLHSAWIFLAAFVLSLPLPIPLVNSFPAWWIILLALGMLARDGLLIIIAYITYAIGVCYLALWAVMGAHIIQWIKGLLD